LTPDSEETQADLDRARSALYRSAIQGAFAKNDLDAGLELHGRAAPQLIPADATVLDPLVAIARERKIGREYSDALPGTEASSMADLKQAHLDATAQNETDWPDDANQRATNQHFIDVKFGKAMRGALDTQAELRRSVADWLTRPGPNGEAQTERPPVAMWAALSPEERDQVDHILLRAPWETPRSRPKIELLPKPPVGPKPPDKSWMYPQESENPRTMPGIGIMPALPPPTLPPGAGVAPSLGQTRASAAGVQRPSQSESLAGQGLIREQPMVGGRHQLSPRECDRPCRDSCPSSS
jgi:hypothetical protein